MALGKYSRVDGRKSSTNYCSTVTIVVFVALCLVGVWMMTSSSVVPDQNADVSQQPETKNDVNQKTQVAESNVNDNSVESANNGSKEDTGNDTNSNDNEGKSKQFEDGSGDLPDDATKGDSNENPPKEENNTNLQAQENQTGEDEKKEGGELNSEEVSKNETAKEQEKKDSEEEPKSEEKDSEAGETNDSNVEKNDNDGEQKSEENSDEMKDGEKGDVQSKEQSGNEVFPSGAQSELLNETTTGNGSFSTQATLSKNEKDKQSSEATEQNTYSWKVCNVTAGPDYIPCLDNMEAIRSLRSTKHYEHRERHCPDNPPTCLVVLPEGYRRPIAWPTSREKVGYKLHYLLPSFFYLKKKKSRGF